MNIFDTSKTLAKEIDSMKLNHKIMQLLSVMICSAIHAELPKNLSLKTELHSYVNNSEYYNDYREGILLLGLSSSIYFNYMPTPQLSFSIGTYLKKEFGDSPYYSDARPYLQSRYRKNGYSMFIGVMDTTINHGLSDALLTKEANLQDGLDEGFQLLFDCDAIYADLWMTVHQLNTPEHREHLDFGVVLKKGIGPITTIGQIYWDHYGGQLYAPVGDPVRENTAGMVEIRYDHFSGDSTRGVGGSTSFLGSTTNAEHGYGGTINSWFMLNRFKTSMQVFKGDNFDAWRGNSMYKANDIYYFIQLERKTKLLENMTFEWGGRFDFVDIPPQEWTNHADLELWAECKTNFKIPLFDKK